MSVPVPPVQAGVSGRFEYRAIVNALMFAVAIVGSTMFVLSPLLTDIARSLDVATARVLLLPGAYAAALAVMAPLVGLGMQSVPRARVVAAGLLVYALAWLLGSLSQSFVMLLGCASLAGGATGAVLPSCYACAAEVSLSGHRARVMGRIVGGWAIAFLAVMPVTALTQLVGWRGALRALALGACLVAVAVLSSRKPPNQPAAERLDVHLILRSLREVLGDRPTAMLLLVNLVDMGAFFAVYGYLGTELRQANDWTASPAGLTMSAYGLGLVIVTFNARWIDRIGQQRAAFWALSLLGLVLTLLPWTMASPWLAALAIGGWGLVQGSVFTAVTALSTQQVPSRRPVVTALLACSTYAGVTAFTPVAVYLYQHHGYGALGAVCALGCVLAAQGLRTVTLKH